MAGEGKFPLSTGWLSSARAPLPLYKSAVFGDLDDAEVTAWNAWFFGVASGSSGPVGLASETDSALALSGKLIGSTGLATETDSAFALTSGASGSVGLATETDTALALGGVLIGAVGMAVETDTALALAAGAPGTQVGLATESDTAFALAGVQRLIVGLAIETDTALVPIIVVPPSQDASPVYGRGRRERARVDDITEDQVREHWDRLDALRRADAAAREAAEAAIAAAAASSVSDEPVERARQTIATDRRSAALPAQPIAAAHVAVGPSAPDVAPDAALDRARQAEEDLLLMMLLAD